MTNMGRIEPSLEGKASDRGRTGANKHLLVEAVLWTTRTGMPWRDLPHEFGPWNTVIWRFTRWADKGVWQAIFAKLSEDADFDEVYLVSTIVHAHLRAAGASKKGTTRFCPSQREDEHQDSYGGQ